MKIELREAGNEYQGANPVLTLDASPKSDIVQIGFGPGGGVRYCVSKRELVAAAKAIGESSDDDSRP